LLAGLLAALFVAQPRWAWLAVVAATLLTAGAFIRFLGTRVGLLVLLIVACLLDHYTFPFSRFDFRAEQIAALIAIAVLVVTRLRERDTGWLRPTASEGALMAWFVLGFISDLVAAPNRAQSFKILALLVVSASALFLPRRLILSREEADEVIRWLLLAIAGESVYALVIYFLHVFGPIVSLATNPVGGHLYAYGTLWEPNVLGSVCGAGAIAWAYLGRRYFTSTWPGMALCLSGTVVSLTRSAWVAVAVVLVLTVLSPYRHRIDIRSLAVAMLATAVVIGAVLGVDRFGNYYQRTTVAGPVVGAPPASTGFGSSRLIVVLANGVDALGRLYQFNTAFGDLKRSPLLGSGTDSYGQRHTYLGLPEHIANLELSVLNDTGIFGLLLFGAFGTAIAVVTWRNRREPIVVGLGAMVLVVAIANQSTETLELMITWLLLGLLLAASDVVQNDQVVKEEAHSSR
jgi:hypothetical protein